MSDAKTLLRAMQALAEAAAPEIVTTVTGSANSITSDADNFVQAQDGFHRIDFDDDRSDAAYVVDYASDTNVLTLHNLTTGEIESVDIGAAPIAENGGQAVRFDALGAEITLNAAFDMAVGGDGIVSAGGAFSAAGGGGVLASSIKITDATGGGGQGLTTNLIEIDGTTANAATLSIGGYSSSGVDLSDRGFVTAALSDGADSFTVEFFVTSAFSNIDDGGLTVNGLGAMVFADASTEIAPFVTSGDVSRLFDNVTTRLNIQPDGDNLLQPEDGFESIVFGADVSGTAAILVSYDAGDGVLKARDLTNGLTQAVAIGRDDPIADGETQTVSFDALSLTVALNHAFDKTRDLDEAGATPVLNFGGGEILEPSIRLTAATSSAGDDLETAVLQIDATDASAATLFVGDGFSEAGVDLSSTGVKTATLTDGTDAFTIEFLVVTAFSDGDDASFDLQQFGQLVFADPQGDITTTGGDGDDRIVGGAAGDRIDGGAGDDTLRGAGGDDIVLGGDGDDVFAGLYGSDSYDGGAGADTLLLSERADNLEARLSAGTVTSAEGDTASLTDVENAVGGDGDDELRGDSGANALLGGDGDDMLRGGGGDDALDGGGGDDLIGGSRGDDAIEGGAGNDDIAGELGDDWIHGGDGADILNGGSGDDRLFGDAGDDVITGDSGLNRLKGGDGADQFRIKGGIDRIYDFEDGVDVIDVRPLDDVDGLDDLVVTSVRDGDATLIETALGAGSGNGVVLIGVDASSIDASDFQF